MSDLQTDIKQDNHPGTWKKQNTTPSTSRKTANLQINLYSLYF